MPKVNLETKASLHIYLLNFENVNMYSKGNYRLKIEAEADNARCLVSSPDSQKYLSELGKKENQQYFSKEFMVRFQNQRVQINQLLFVDSPTLKNGRESKITIKVTLLKAECCKNEGAVTEYVPLRTSSWIIRFVTNTTCEYAECAFQEPFLSVLSAMILVQPSCISIDTKIYSISEEATMVQLKKQVKKMRYNSYLLGNKFKRIFYSPFDLEFTLPKMFVSNEFEMDEVPTDEEMFLNYLVQYESIKLTLDMMNYELVSICFKNDELFRIFDENCVKGTMYTSKLRMEFQEKEEKRYKMYIVKEEYKERYEEEYKQILKEKLKVLNHEMEISFHDEILNNISFKMESNYEQIKPSELPSYPIIVQETLRLKNRENGEEQVDMIKENSDKKVRYLLILAHGYQGSPDDLAMIANGFKKRYKKTKYLILKSYSKKMSECTECMVNCAVQQINNYLDCIQFKEKTYRIVMLGHSMGGLILRLASNKIKYAEYLYAYISLGTPHLGYLQGLKLHIRAGLSLFSNLYSNPCLNQIAGKDAQELHETAIYKMSKSGQLGNFRKVILVASNKDKYVSWHSARIQNFNKDFLKRFTFIENEMVSNILGPLGRLDRIDRLQVDFKCVESSVDKIIGRTCHIKMLTDCSFIELLCNSCVPHVFDD